MSNTNSPLTPPGFSLLKNNKLMISCHLLKISIWILIQSLSSLPFSPWSQPLIRANYRIQSDLEPSLWSGGWSTEPSYWTDAPACPPQCSLESIFPSLEWAPLWASLPRSFLKDRVGIPSLAVSICNDDPGFWDIDALVSYDWYVAVLGWELSLSGIKQLAIDSIVHSGASVKAKA